VKKAAAAFTLWGWEMKASPRFDAGSSHSRSKRVSAHFAIGRTHNFRLQISLEAVCKHFSGSLYLPQSPQKIDKELHKNSTLHWGEETLFDN
jgi:hypothetical protein